MVFPKIVACIKEYRENRIDIVNTETVIDNVREIISSIKNNVREIKGCDWNKMSLAPTASGVSRQKKYV